MTECHHTLFPLIVNNSGQDKPNLTMLVLLERTFHDASLTL